MKKNISDNNSEKETGSDSSNDYILHQAARLYLCRQGFEKFDGMFRNTTVILYKPYIYGYADVEFDHYAIEYYYDFDKNNRIILSKPPQPYLRLYGTAIVNKDIWVNVEALVSAEKIEDIFKEEWYHDGMYLIDPLRFEEPFWRYEMYMSKKDKKTRKESLEKRGWQRMDTSLYSAYVAEINNKKAEYLKNISVGKIE